MSCFTQKIQTLPKKSLNLEIPNSLFANIFSMKTYNPKKHKTYQMLIRIEANTIRKKEIRPGFARYCGLDPPDWLRDGPKLQSPNAGGRQQRRKDHMVPRRHANDVVYIGVQAFHEPAPGPTRAQDHHPRLLAGLRGAQT